MKTCKFLSSIIQIIGIFIYTSSALSFMNSTALEKDCQRLNGVLRSTFQSSTILSSNETIDSDIPNSQKMILYCTVNSKSEVPITFDGCSTPKGVLPFYTEFFYESCKRHDICYHHTLEHNAHGKHECDLSFYDNMVTTCKNNLGPDSLWSECGSTLGIFYQAVESFGEKSFNHINIPLEPSEYTHIYGPFHQNQHKGQ